MPEVPISSPVPDPHAPSRHADSDLVAHARSRARQWAPIAVGIALLGIATPSARADELTSPPETQAIIGGEVVKPGEYPQVVAILGGPFLCSGTVVSDDVVITAAHCLAELSAGTPLAVLPGEDIKQAAPNPVIEYGVHPDFVATPGAQDIHDIAYVRTKNPLGTPTVLPVATQNEWDEVMQYDHEVLLVGYGDGPDDNLGTGIKRKVTVPITKFSPKGLEFTAGGDGKDTCPGDSGGPAFLQLSNGKLRLAGITSRGSDPCGKGGIYAAPYAGLCWLRDTSGLDLTNGCSNCDCLDTTPPPKKGDGCGSCRSGGAGPGWLVWAFVLVALGGRRRAQSRSRSSGGVSPRSSAASSRRTSARSSHSGPSAST